MMEYIKLYRNQLWSLFSININPSKHEGSLINTERQNPMDSFGS